MTASLSVASPDAPEVRLRILQVARAEFFAHGYSGFRMDDLATELGMSKKTLYVHFPGKDSIVRAVIDELFGETRAEAERLLEDPELAFAEKLRGFIAGLMQRMAALQPRTLRDLQRYAPGLHDHIVALRQEHLPYIFGHFVTLGRTAGLVRDDVDTPFAIEFLLHAIQGLLQPPVLERFDLSPREGVARAIRLFFGGILSPAGHQEYENIFSR